MIPQLRDEARIVSGDDIAALIADVQRQAAQRGVDPSAGIFGPDSISWKINRESALFLGAGRAALLQLAHPWVAAALEQHSSLMAKPIARFHNTFRIVFTMIFGSLDQASRSARHLHSLHTQIQGAVPEDIAAYARGSHYQANQIAALRWVYATLVESAVLAYECVRPPLTVAERAAYYAESRTLAALFGLPASDLPESWEAFIAYCRAMENSSALGVSAGARQMAHNLLAGAGSWIKPPHWYRSLTTLWLPPRFRAEFQLSYQAAESQAAARARQRLPRIYRSLPASVRFIGPWREANARIRNRTPGPITRISNRFWLGQPLLTFRTDTAPRPVRPAANP
ncbi:MAG TPA: oxygenase MpaB family protein [Terracidiphilus sp.]